MADLKPLGSEKLNGDDKLKRILELTYYNENKKSTSQKAELVKESKTGGVYGIVREKDAYYVKRGLNETSLDYIGGMFMKNKNKFTSYAEAFKRLELLKGQEELQEATKYVLKTNKPKEEAPMPEPSLDVAPESGDVAADLPPADASVGDVPPPAPEPESSSDISTDTVGSEGKRSDYMAEAQKYAGKLGQELRDLKEKMESDDIKYILNMIISAVDLDKLDDEDIEEIGKKFERDEEVSGEEVPAEEPSSEDDVPAEEPSKDAELDEDSAMDALDEFINSPSLSADEIDLSSYTSSEKNEVDLSANADLESVDEEKELDLDEIKNSINQAVGETLSKYFNN